MNDLKRHVPLYLKHRPQTLEQLVGQAAVLKTLSNAINHDRISHAYLFTGPRGTGKTSSARILAKSLNCKATDKATVTPCCECTSCEEIKTCSSPAVIEIDAASNNSVDDARILIERAPLVAPGARYKIYIIDECHMLTKEAFNALLKTIEDPPPNVVFILATTEEHKVLPTIISRCQRLMFRLATQTDLLLHLRNVAQKEDIEITDEALEFVARRSGGGLRDALGLLDQASLLSAPGKPVDVKDLLSLLGALQEDVLLEMSDHVLERRGHGLLQSAAKLLQDGREPAIVVQELARHFLNLAKASYLAALPNAAEAVNSLIIGSPSYLESLQTQAPKFERSELSQMVEMLDRLEGTCRRTTQPAMHLEVGLLALCHRQDMILIRELSERVAKLEQGHVPAQAGPAPRAVASHAPAAPRPTAATPGAAPAATPAAAPVSTSAAAPVSTSAAAPVLASAAAPATTPGAAPVATSAASSAPAYASAPAYTPSTPAVPAPNPIPIPMPNPIPPAAAAAPIAKPAAPSAVAPPEDNEYDGAGASADEVDRVWSVVIDELQRRNLPAYAVVTQHAFPIALTEKEFVIGVKEAMLKSVEGKAEHIKAACTTATGKPLHVRFKPTASAPSPPPVQAASARPAMREERTPAPVASGAPGPGDDYDDPDPAPRVKLDDVSPAPASETAQAAGTNPDQPRAANAAAPPKDTILKEAYKLFEGPGSRQIG